MTFWAGSLFSFVYGGRVLTLIRHTVAFLELLEFQVEGLTFRRRKVELFAPRSPWLPSRTLMIPGLESPTHG